MNWSNVLKAPRVQPFSQGSTRVEGKLVGEHPLPLVGSYLNYLNKLVDEKDRHSLAKWWKHGRIKVVGGHEADMKSIENPKERNLPILGVKHMKDFMKYNEQLKPPTWEEFISKINDKDEFEAASVIFGDEFPENEQDMRNAKWMQPSFRYRKPEQQARREQRHKGKWEQEYQVKVDKIYKKIRKDFAGIVGMLEQELIAHRNSDPYKELSDPRLRAYFFVKEIANELPTVEITESQKGLLVYITPTWEKDLRRKYPQYFGPDDKATIRIKMNPSTGQGEYNQCIDLMKVSPSGKKARIHTVCLTSESAFPDAGGKVWAGDFYVSILYMVNDTKSLHDFQGMADVSPQEWFAGKRGNWKWQRGGNPQAANYIDWTVSEVSRDIYSQLFQNIERLRDELLRWGQYWVQEVGEVEMENTQNPFEGNNPEEWKKPANPGGWEFRTSNDKNLIGWEDILKTSQRKVRQPRTSTIDLSALTEHSKHNLLPNWVQNNTRSETKYGVQVQYKAFIDMFKAALLSKNDRLLLCSWYLRSYIPKIHSKLQSLLTGSGEEEMYNPFDSKKKPKVRYNPYNLIPIKSITGKLLSYVYIKYDKTGPSIEFITLVPNTQHAKVKNATVLDLGNGRFESNWENNEFIKNHIRNVFGAAELGETPPPPTTSRTIGDVVDEEKKADMAPVDDDDDWYLSLFEAFIKFHSFVLRKLEGNPSYMSDQVLEELEDMVEVVRYDIELIKRGDFAEAHVIRVEANDIRNFLSKYALTYKFKEFWDGRFESHTATDEEMDDFGRKEPKIESKTNGKTNGFKKAESWWVTLKEGGPITSAKAGITNMTYGKGAQKPKKKKKFKPKKEKDLEPKMPPMPPKPIKPEKEHEIIPDEPDFWRD